jgi:hypothetical protein
LIGDKYVHEVHFYIITDRHIAQSAVFGPIAYITVNTNFARNVIDTLFSIERTKFEDF